MRAHFPAAAAQPHVGGVFDQHRRHAPDRSDPGFREDREIATEFRAHYGLAPGTPLQLPRIFDSRFYSMYYKKCSKLEPSDVSSIRCRPPNRRPQLLAWLCRLSASVLSDRLR